MLAQGLDDYFMIKWQRLILLAFVTPGKGFVDSVQLAHGAFHAVQQDELIDVFIQVIQIAFHLLMNEHGITIAEKPIVPGDGFLVRFHNQVIACKGRD